MENDRKCTTKEKLVFFILNFSILLESGVIFGFGIVGLTINYIVSVVIHGNLFICLVVIYVIVGGVGILSCFIGSCAGVFGNKCIMLTYVACLGISLILLFTGAIFGFVFGNQLQTNSSDVMYITLTEYDLNKNSSDINDGWDWLQSELKCCGVTYFMDWQDENNDFRGKQRIPESCCKPENRDQNSTNSTICTLGKETKMFYSGAVQGCHSKVLEVFEKYAPVVIGLGGIEAILLVIGLTCGGIAYNFL